MSDMRIGISGWTYPPWRGTFFPRGWPQKRELEFASRQVNSIEINGSFYSLQRPSSYRAWYEATPPEFIFSVKGGRFITHLKRLKDAEKPLANFFASGVLCLKEKLGPFLWQLPPSFRFDRDRLSRFFDLLPRDTIAASKLARKHDGKVKGRAATSADEKRALRHALEVRHASFETPEFIHLLRNHDIALVVADTAGKWPFIEDVTSDFIYVRLHGDKELYVSGYTDDDLAEWARKVRAWSRGRTPAKTHRLTPAPRAFKRGRDVFVYFDNDVKVRAPFDAMSLAHRLRLCPAPPRAPDAEKIAETARRGWPAIRRQWHATTVV
jgi:uncharacterized protein YecE (DUF72 family)